MFELFLFFVVIFMWVNGFMLAWAINNQQNPFWRGYLDMITFRILWKR